MYKKIKCDMSFSYNLIYIQLIGNYLELHVSAIDHNPILNVVS